MDTNKIIEDFQKRYEKPPKNIFFCGKPVIFLWRPGMVLGTSVSAGGYIATSKRDDDRIQLQYSDSNRLFCKNAEELKIYRGEKICDLLLRLQEIGITIGGADILIHENTDFEIPIETLLLCSHGSFCKNALPPGEVIKHFQNYEENFICMHSKSSRIIAASCGKAEYLPFHNQKYKIVISAILEKMGTKDYATASADDAREALLAQDAEKFGDILNKSTSVFLKKCRAKKSRSLFETAVGLGASLGNGILPSGGIFSIVENNRVDTFIHNLGSACEKHYGGRPEFYVTKAEDSGTRLPLPEE